MSQGKILDVLPESGQRFPSTLPEAALCFLEQVFREMKGFVSTAHYQQSRFPSPRLAI